VKHTPKLTIFGTHNLQTFKHNTLINKLLLIQFLAGRTNGRAIATLLRLSVVCDVMYCG